MHRIVRLLLANWKTTLAGLALLLSAAAGVLLTWAGKATLTEVGTFLTVVSSVLAGIGLLSAKDGDKLPFVALLSVGLFATGCTPQKRLHRLLRKHPHLATATIGVDTVRLPGTHADTLFRFSTAQDTVVLKEGRATARYFYDHRRDTVFLSAACADTVLLRPRTVLNVAPPAPRRAGKPPLMPWWAWALVGAGLGALKRRL